ncbi:hypothetical protein GUJ93_ZPchr0006g46446 [Zizania palustris]|uniref:Uncharacterized protein n=1 Tax=Zizania palustris TaxID=103762 RepID=A0A8J5SJH1_ZIZPA|nr:hypothetical protein GUJ93_ZPchr0006g46446 [Zizania palustris]
MPKHSKNSSAVQPDSSVSKLRRRIEITLGRFVDFAELAASADGDGELFAVSFATAAGTPLFFLEWWRSQLFAAAISAFRLFAAVKPVRQLDTISSSSDSVIQSRASNTVRRVTVVVVGSVSASLVSVAASRE